MTESQVLEQFNTSWALAEKHVPALVGSNYMKRRGWDLFVTDLLANSSITQDQFDQLTNPF